MSSTRLKDLRSPTPTALPRLLRAAPLLAAAFIGGCAYAPGFWLGRSSIAEQSEAERQAAAVRPQIIDWALVRAFESAEAADTARIPVGTEAAYRIGPGDALRINVWNHPDLNLPPNLSVTTITAASGAVAPATNVVPHRVVSHDGYIQFPLIGRVRAVGLTAPALRDAIASGLRKYLKDPQVEVELASYRSQRVFMVGELKTPGNLSITDVPLRIADAVGQAGGATPAADLSMVTVARGDQRFVVDLERLFYEGDLSRNLLLQHGDVITVPDRRERKIFVLGEVMQPRSYALPRGRTTLAEALSDAGGPNPLSANTGQVFVLRADTDDRTHVFQLDARSPEALILADRFVLRPRDVVYVDPTQLARAGRVLAQVLPWLQGANTTRNITD